MILSTNDTLDYAGDAVARFFHSKKVLQFNYDKGTKNITR